ncbi:MAG TPA: hypothetical protein VE965_05635 [Gammaproteobacteria bacterium]|nr:hypothetical protein [Gammaproteobacteria bacterium]
MNANLHLMETLRRSLAMLIPVWFPLSVSPEQIRDSLLATLYDCEHYLPWEHVVLVVDGDERSHRIVQDLQAACKQRYGCTFDVIYNVENRGKGAAVCRGAEWFLAKRGLDYLTIRDADGDHVLNDLPNLMRQAMLLRATEGIDHLIIVGRRSDSHRAVGFMRGEFETLLNRVLIETMRFALAQQQRVLNTRYLSRTGDDPDLHSGYKLYSRSICELIVQHPWDCPPWVGEEIYRYGVEAVPFVEGVLAGAIVAEINRLVQEPRFTGHGAFARPETNGSVILWTFLRLGIRAHQAAALLDNFVPHLALWSDPRGRETLLAFRRYILETLFTMIQPPSPIPDMKDGAYF